jgi:xanthine/CO dehydrogenase XdhC/CoxF family maturation factor
MALITVLGTEGSTYSKAGSQMLVNEHGDFHGMLSGGCLEGDLAERSRKIIETNIADVVTYDLRGDDDVFGLGVGCEGALRILIQPICASSSYEPFASLVRTLEDEPFIDISLADAGEAGSTRILAPLRLTGRRTAGFIYGGTWLEGIGFESQASIRCPSGIGPGGIGRMCACRGRCIAFRSCNVRRCNYHESQSGSRSILS